MPEEEGDHVGIDFGREIRVDLQRLQFRGEHERLAGPAEIEGLLADAVAREMQTSALTIPNGEREHAIDVRQRRFDPPLVDRRKEDFGIRVTSEPMSHALEVPPQLPK